MLWVLWVLWVLVLVPGRSMMGATAFQKGLGAMHSLSHPCGVCHATAMPPLAEPPVRGVLCHSYAPPCGVCHATATCMPNTRGKTAPIA